MKKTANHAKTCVPKILRTQNCQGKFIQKLLELLENYKNYSKNAMKACKPNNRDLNRDSIR